MLQRLNVSDELLLTMARAFDQAWDDFTRRGVLVDSKTMRAELAACIVEKAKAGANDERKFAQAGLKHLREMHRAPPGPTDCRHSPKSKYDLDWPSDPARRSASTSYPLLRTADGDDR